MGAWSAWAPVAGLPVLDERVLAETLDGGQAFRWHRVENTGDAAPPQRASEWLGIWSDCVTRVRLNSAGHLEWSAPTTIAARVAQRLPEYFAIAGDFSALVDLLPWRSDPHLATCLTEFRGLRILRQPFGETLLGFLCSATKQIVQIKQMLALLAERHGAEICRAGSPNPAANHAARQTAGFGDPARQPIHRLPTWPELAGIPETELRGCLLGFRAKFISETARFLAAHPGWLADTEALPYAVAKERLCSLPGVGEKIADCVLLFGAGKLEAFPVDVWILKTMAHRYGLDDWKPAHVAQFGRAHFGALAGFAQQFLFAYERAAAKRSSVT